MAQSYESLEKQSGADRAILFNIDQIVHNGAAMIFDDIRAAVKGGPAGIPRKEGDASIRKALAILGWKRADESADYWSPPVA